MFVPEVYLFKWRDMQEILPQAKVILYTIDGEYYTFGYSVKAKIQAFNGICVFTIILTPSDVGLEKLRDETNKCVREYDSATKVYFKEKTKINELRKKRDEAINRLKTNFTRLIKEKLSPHKFYEGRFTSLVIIAEPEE